MAVVTLRTLWLNNAADPSKSQSFPLMKALQVTTARKGEVREYSAGRLRSVTKRGGKRSLTASLPHCTREQVAWLEQQQSQLLCVRDDRGRKFWAVYYDLPVDEHFYNTDADLQLVLNEVTHTEAV